MSSRLVFISFVCLLLLQTVSSTQFTSDRCCQDSDCEEDRSCIFFDILDGAGFDAGPCAPGKRDCTCSQGAEGFVPCIVDLECLEGDVCDATPEGSFCVSKCLLAISGRRELEEEEKPLCDKQPSFPEVCPPENPMRSESPETPGGTVPPATSPNSQPMPDPDVEPNGVEEPSANDDEKTPQIAATPQSAPVAEPSPTTPEATPAPEVVASPEPTTAVCVAVEELEGVQKVFERDYHAWVLCDTAGSCATPGHMVMWNGDGMMMKSYCEIVGCERKVMAVNSPRWGAGVIRAKTEGLAYTSFAARWESSAEERVLSAVVRLAV